MTKAAVKITGRWNHPGHRLEMQNFVLVDTASGQNANSCQDCDYANCVAHVHVTNWKSGIIIGTATVRLRRVCSMCLVTGIAEETLVAGGLPYPRNRRTSCAIPKGMEQPRTCNSVCSLPS